jgi:large subunit ribosomal protein L13
VKTGAEARVRERRRERGRKTVGTFTPKPGDIDRRWHVIDASDIVLGRLASQAATLLRGKHKPTFANHVDTGDFVVIINAEKVAVAQQKLGRPIYRHSGYPGGLSKRTVGELLETKPERVIELAVKGMLPKNSLGRQQLKKLKVYAGPNHPHTAQKPQPFEIKQVAQ